MANLGDGLDGKKHLGSGAKDAYYAWKLVADKLAVHGDDRYSESAKKVLGAVSQKEAIKFQILTKIQGDDYAESSANYAMLCRATGEEDKLAQAEVLAEKIFQKQRDKSVLKALVGSEDGFDAVMAKPSTGGAGGGIGGAIAGALTAFGFKPSA